MKKKHKATCPNVTSHIWIVGNGAWMGGAWDMGACSLKHSPKTCHVAFKTRAPFTTLGGCVTKKKRE
jgi:hypothetical protein